MANRSGAVALLILGFVAGCVFYQAVTSEEIRSLRSRVESLENDNSILRNENAGLKKSITALQEENENLGRRVSELEAGGSAIGGEPAILAVRFSPKGGAASQVAYWLGRANESVHVLIYSFTLDAIGDAILGAYRRGVDVRVVFEESQINAYSEYFRLRGAGVQVRNDTNRGLMHHKVAIIDGYVVLIGSFNWTASADEENDENLLVVRSRYLASVLELEFQRIWNAGK